MIDTNVDSGTDKMGRFDNYIENITPDIHNKTKSYISTNLAIFEPEDFILDKEICFDDYHFIMLFTTPPPAKIDKKPRQFKKGNLVSFDPGACCFVNTNDSTQGIGILLLTDRSFEDAIAFYQGVMEQGKITMETQQDDMYLIIGNKDSYSITISITHPEGEKVNVLLDITP